MKKLLLFFLLLCSNVVMARTLKIVKLNTETIKIGNNRICKVGSKFEETEEIKWDSPKQAMWAKVVSGESRELMHFTREAFISKKAKTPAEYFQKINHPSVRADEMSYLAGNNKSSFPEKRLALVIGNSNYDYLSSLNNPVNDASDVTDKLQSLGFDVYSLYDINYSDFDTALKKFSGTARNYDVALIYYCGHGIQYDGQNYLVPVDTKLDNVDDLLRCIDLEDIYSKLNRTSCSTKLLFLDACRNEAPWKEKEELFNEQDASGIRVVFSTGPNKFSYDGIENRNSPFAEAFLLNIGETSPNVLLTINDIAYSLMNICQRMGLPMQEVHDFGSSFIDFTFVSKKDNPYSYDKTDELSNQVLINAKLLDSVFIKTDPFISKKIDYNDYMGISQYDNGEIELGPFYDCFHYIETNKDGYTVIRPDGDYVGDYYLNDSITIQDCGFLLIGEDGFTNDHHPVLDVTLVNNSESTILVNELLIDVEESYLDKNPFVIFYETEGKIYVEDRGWRPWKNAKFRFSLLPDNQPFDGKYKFERTLYPSAEGQTIPMYDYFVQSGIDFPKLCTSSLVNETIDGEIPFWSEYNEDPASIDTLKKLLYPIELRVKKLYDVTGEEERLEYIDPYLVIHGELIFDNNSRFKVGGTVRFLTSEGWGAPYLECSRLVDVKLRTEGKNYTIKYPVSHYLKKGDVDRIAIQIDADKTSYHKFRIRLHNTHQIDIKTDPIDLLIFKYN